MIGRCFTENVYKEVDFHYLPRCLSIIKKLIGTYKEYK